MRWRIFVLIALFLTVAALSLRAVDPIPESGQALAALKLLDAYRGTNSGPSSKKLHIVYFTPSDRDPEPRYPERLDLIMENIRAFYRDGMEQAGFGPKTFDLARDAEGKLIIHLVKSQEPEAAFVRSGHQQDGESDAISREKIMNECRSALRTVGIAFEQETVLMFCNLARWDEKKKTFSHHSPYAGFANHAGGWCFAVDSVILNAEDLSRKEPMLKDAEWGEESLGKFNTVFIGGIAHEIGHAFSLPHCGERWDEAQRGKSVMGIGNHTYREELRGEGPGTFLTMASAMKLASRPLFSKSDGEVDLKVQLGTRAVHLSTNVTRQDLVGRPRALRLDGTVKGTPPVYGVIAYFDARNDGYHAPTATAVPDGEGHFAVEISDIEPSDSEELRIQYCHVNGAVSEGRIGFKLARDGKLTLQEPDGPKALRQLTRAVLEGDPNAARTELGRIEKGDADELTKTVARKLAATLENEIKPVPTDVSTTTNELALGDASAKSSEVGWLQPAANRVPVNSEIQSPVLDAGKIFATGLYAHAPSRYVFELGGKWKTLRGEAGLHAMKQSSGSVVFVIKADGKELFRSPIIRGSARAGYKVDVSGAEQLELMVEDGGDGNSNDWGLWLDPTLVRDRQTTSRPK
jgi:NPCBM/NEW2 domain/Putative peptidase family